MEWPKNKTWCLEFSVKEMCNTLCYDIVQMTEEGAPKPPNPPV